MNIIRDGTQSAEGNRLRHSDILDIVHKIDDYMQLLPKGALAVCESWGGASVSEPVRLNGEDSFENLENIIKTAPNIIHSCLYRGTQGFGYMPLSASDQEIILEGVCQIGVQHFRIFDMMNDADNLKPSVLYLHHLKQHTDYNPTIELAICVNSERDKTTQLRTESYYTQIIQEYLSLKPDRFAIKDYSGLCDYSELKLVIDLIRQFDTEIPIAIHSHTEKSETLAHLLHNGASTVDVGMSAWAGGNAHSDYFKTLYFYLEYLGYDTKNAEIKYKIEHHPLILKVRQIESLCDLIAPPYKAIRVPSHKQPHKNTLFNAKIAAGGLVAMRDMLVANLKSAQKYLESQQKTPPSEEHLMDAALYKMAELWDNAGRPDTVTPGSLILSKAANNLTFQEQIYHKTITLKDIPQDYKNLTMGRYGKNWGFNAGFGNVPMRHLFLIESGLLYWKQAAEHDAYLRETYQKLCEDYPFIEVYNLQQNVYTELLTHAFDYMTLIKGVINQLPDTYRLLLSEKFQPALFSSPASLLHKAQKQTQEVFLSGLTQHAYGRHIDQKWLEKRLLFLFMSVKPEHVHRMIQFKADGIVRGTIEKDPRAIFWRDTICAGNVRQAYHDLVELMQLYPPGKMTRSNRELRARKRRTLSLTMTEMGIDNDFMARSDIKNIYLAHRKVAAAIINAKKSLSKALDHCVAEHQDYQFYKSKITATVLKQAMLDSINIA